MLDEIRCDPRMADVLIEGAEYLRCEIVHAARREMVTRLEDFLRRRSKIALVLRRDDLAKSPGLREACRILFGDDAERRHEEYFREPGGGTARSSPAEHRAQALLQPASGA
jgi:glycerol-3-phosphate dehydrogenase